MKLDTITDQADQFIFLVYFSVRHPFHNVVRAHNKLSQSVAKTTRIYFYRYCDMTSLSVGMIILATQFSSSLIFHFYKKKKIMEIMM